MFIILILLFYYFKTSLDLRRGIRYETANMNPIKLFSIWKLYGPFILWGQLLLRIYLVKLFQRKGFLDDNPGRQRSGIVHQLCYVNWPPCFLLAAARLGDPTQPQGSSQTTLQACGRLMSKWGGRFSRLTHHRASSGRAYLGADNFWGGKRRGMPKVETRCSSRRVGQFWRRDQRSARPNPRVSTLPTAWWNLTIT